MTSGKRYWSDGSIVAGQQFEYSFDDIGNRKTAASGGDEWGANLRYENYSANSLNQYTQRTVPPYVNVLGAATNFATVTVNLQPTYRKGEYFRAELNADNTSAPLWFGITNVGVLTNGGGPNIVTTNQGNLLVAKATDAFLHDLDGNLTSDSLWTNTWNGENRLIATESATGVPSAGKAKETWSHLPDGRWIERVVANWNGSAYTNAYTNRFIWDGQVLLAIVNHTNGLITSLARGLDLSGSLQGAGGVGGVLAVNIATNGAHFAAFDGNGNISALVSATNGAVTASYEYSPFGETLRANGVVANANPIRFSTQFADDVTGDLKYLFRDYRALSGRWPNRDPIEEAGGLNLFAAMGNDAVNMVDALGLQCVGHDCKPGDGGNEDDPHFCTPPNPPPPPSPHDPPGFNRVPVYNPPDAGKPCCDKPAILKTAKRTDPPATKGTTTRGNTSWTINMQLDLKIDGVYKNLEIYWTTCWRIDRTSGVIPTCSNKLNCSFPTVTSGTIGGPYVTTARIFWLSCGGGKWTKKKHIAGGGYVWEKGKWDFTSATN